MAPATAVATITKYPELEMASIESSGLNPRTHWDKASDAELVQSIEVDGVLEPIIVRPHPTKGNVYQIVAGERRFKAASVVGLGQIPAIVRDVPDEKLLELALTENIQRRSMHPLDEANGFVKRLEMGQTTPEQLANTLGLSARYVTDRCRLTKLNAKAMTMLESGEMTVSHAIILAKLDPKVQEAALADCGDWELDFETGKDKKVLGPVSQLREWVADNVRLDPTSLDVQAEFPEVAEEVQAAAAVGATVVMLTEKRTPWQHKAKPDDPLFAEHWLETKKTDKAATVGVIVEGRRRGQRIFFKSPPPPKKEPARASSTSTSSDLSAAEQKKRDERIKREQAAERQRRELAKQWSALKSKATTALIAHIKAMPIKAVLAAVAKRERVTHDGTADGFVRAMAAQTASQADYSPDSFGYATKALGFDVKKWMKTELAAAKKAAPAKKAKKR